MKRLLIIVLSLAIFLSVGSSVSAATYMEPEEVFPPPKAMIGDSYIDGTVDARDALKALEFSVKGYGSNWRFPRGEKRFLEMEYVTYHKSENKESFVNGQQGSVSKHYYLNNSRYFADVNKDDEITAQDALLILQYIVGKLDKFPHSGMDCSFSFFHYTPWYTDWEPKMMSTLSDRWYEGLVWPPAEQNASTATDVASRFLANAGDDITGYATKISNNYFKDFTAYNDGEAERTE